MSMMLSVVIPAHNEADSIPTALRGVYAALTESGVDHEIVVVDDHCSDGTAEVVNALAALEVPTARVVVNQGKGGFGLAVRCGLENFSGDAVAVMMADLSDSPDDLVAFSARASRKAGGSSTTRPPSCASTGLPTWASACCSAFVTTTSPTPSRCTDAR